MTMSFEIGGAYGAKDERGVDYVCLCSTFIVVDDNIVPLGFVIDPRNPCSVDVESLSQAMSTYNDSHMLYNMSRLVDPVLVNVLPVEHVQKIIDLVNVKGRNFIESRKYYKANKLNPGLVYDLQGTGERFIAIRKIKSFTDGVVVGGYRYTDEHEGVSWLTSWTLDSLKPHMIGYMKMYDYHVQRHAFSELMKLNPHRETFKIPFDIDKTIIMFH